MVCLVWRDRSVHNSTSSMIRSGPPYFMRNLNRCGRDAPAIYDHRRTDPRLPIQRSIVI